MKGRLIIGLLILRSSLDYRGRVSWREIFFLLKTQGTTDSLIAYISNFKARLNILLTKWFKWIVSIHWLNMYNFSVYAQMQALSCSKITLFADYINIFAVQFFKMYQFCKLQNIWPTTLTGEEVLQNSKSHPSSMCRLLRWRQDNTMLFLQHKYLWWPISSQNNYIVIITVWKRSV